MRDLEDTLNEREREVKERQRAHDAVQSACNMEDEKIQEQPDFSIREWCERLVRMTEQREEEDRQRKREEIEKQRKIEREEQEKEQQRRRDVADKKQRKQAAEFDRQRKEQAKEKRRIEAAEDKR